MNKLMMIAAFGAGYVLGTKAGRERYEQIMSFVEEMQGAGSNGRHPAPEPFGTQQQDEVVHTTGPEVEATVHDLVRDITAARG